MKPVELPVKELPVKTLKPRRPCNAAHLVAVTGAVVIHTPDGSVVITPALARQISGELIGLAGLAEHVVPAAVGG